MYVKPLAGSSGIGRLLSKLVTFSDAVLTVSESNDRRLACKSRVTNFTRLF